MGANKYIQEISEYRAKMDRQLRAPDGWLTLAGLHWLKEGINKIGAATSSTVSLPAYCAPQEVGDLILKDNKVSFHPREGVDARLDGETIKEMIELEPDISRNPTIITIGDLNFHVIIRGDRIGVRVKQVSHPRRLNFTGRVWWPIDERFRLTARIEPYNPPKMVNVPDVLGDMKKSPMDSALLFDLDGKTFSLDTMLMSSGQNYIIFHDHSCGKGSYPAGRFLVTEVPEGDTVVIDFNKAYNPPCAFTPFATCPLPPTQNYLKADIRAGERYKAQIDHKDRNELRAS